MGFFSDMSNNEFDDEELGVTPPIVPSKTVKSGDDVDVVKKRGDQGEDSAVEDDDFLDSVMEDAPRDGEHEEAIEDIPFDGSTAKPEEKQPTKSKKSEGEQKQPPIVEKIKESKLPSVESGTVISSDAIVDGNLTLSSSVAVFGEITGTLKAGDVLLKESGRVLGGIEGENVSIEGKVKGDIKGSNVTIGGCKVQGNIMAGNSMTISSDAIVVGNVTSGEGDVTILGKIKGDVESTGTVLLKTGSVVKGNITAVEVLIDKGTTFQGSVFKAGEIDDSLFDTSD